MGGKAPRDKGNRWQVETKQVFESHQCTAKVTAAMQAADDEHFPDVTAWHHSGLTIAIECKHTKSLPSVGTMKAIRQADGAFPGSDNVARLVSMREQGKPGSSIIAMRSEVLFDLLARIPANGTSSK